MRRRLLRSISVPIVLASTAVPLAIALLIGWTLIFAQNLTRGEALAQNVWLLVLGVISFVVITSVLVMFAVFLAREMIEVRRQDSFIDSVTHELRSPLASLKLALQTLQREQVDEAQRDGLRDMMLRDVDRLSAFIEDVIQASRIAHQRRRTDVTLTRVRLVDMLADCAQGVTFQHHAEPPAVCVEVDPPDLEVTTDRLALQVVIRNLIDNAVKYSEPPARVRVRAHLDEGGGLVVEVEDNGIGIPRKDLRRVFHRFYRVPEDSVRRRKGTGLGLFVVSALVRNLGGRVEAISEGIGTGTLMRVRVPGGPPASPAL
ncbi:MAG: sensor histidine kinase [Sandaracinaceae bacterium]